MSRCDQCDLYTIARIIEFVSLEQVLLVKLKNVLAHLAESFNFGSFLMYSFILNRVDIFDQNLKTLIFTFAPPLDQCALEAYSMYNLYTTDLF